MTQTMRSLQIQEWGTPPAVTETDVPEVGPREVLVEVEAASLGLTVSNSINGDRTEDPALLPRIPGHELVGRIVDLGEGVERFATGDLVTAYTYLVCDHCDYCLRGDHNMCANLAGFLGIHIDGGLAEYAKLPVSIVLPLPDGIDPVDATIVPDAVKTSYHVSKRADIEPGDRVMVLGAGGGVGIHLIQMIQYFGGEVTAVDLEGWKLDACLDLGASQTVNNAEESIVEFASANDTQYDAIVDFTGSMPLLEEALSLLAPRGCLVNLTTFRDRTFSLSPRAQVLQEFDVIGSRSSTKYETKRGGEFVADGVIEPVISEVVGLDGVVELLQRIEAGEVLGRGAVVP